MVNLLGEKGYMGKAIYDGIEKALAHPGVNLHLYGKAQTKPFRKIFNLMYLYYLNLQKPFLIYF